MLRQVPDAKQAARPFITIAAPGSENKEAVKHKETLGYLPVMTHHAYTVLGVHEENGKKYVEMRNPWGTDVSFKDLVDKNEDRKNPQWYWKDTAQPYTDGIDNNPFDGRISLPLDMVETYFDESAIGFYRGL